MRVLFCRPRQGFLAELDAGHRHRALRLQGQAFADPCHLPAGGRKVRPGLQRIHHSRHEPPERAIPHKVGAISAVVRDIDHK